jgi:hypothetical protein
LTNGVFELNDPSLSRLPDWLPLSCSRELLLLLHKLSSVESRSLPKFVVGPAGGREGFFGLV